MFKSSTRMLPRINSSKMIYEARAKKNLSIGELAKKAHLSKNTILRVEDLGVMALSVKSLVAIADTLDLDPTELIRAEIKSR